MQDYDLAVVEAAKAMAMTVIDLLATDGGRSKEVLDSSSPRMTKESYLTLQNRRLDEEMYESVS